MATVKKVKKAQDGFTEKSKMTYKDPLGNYKVKIKQESGDGKVTTSGKARRTLKGFLSGARKPDTSKKNYSSETTYKKGGKVTKAKNGKQMLKRADGTYSQRGLWDNIRANKGSGKKPTAQMLKQEKKIKAKSKK